jgi:hypothetical protein
MMGQIMFQHESLPNERWQAIEGTSSRYFISTFGRLLTMAWKGTDQTRVMKPALDARGYPRTMIIQNGRTGTVKLHRLVALAYLPNPLNLPQVNHKNGQKDDNRVENLEWMDGKQNVQHAFARTSRTMEGTKAPNSKLTEAQVLEIRAKYVPRLYSSARLAKEYSMSVAAIKKILQRAHWKHI